MAGRYNQYPDGWPPRLPDHRQWLASEYYESAGARFNTYDPALWLPTLKVEAGEFMRGLWLLITFGTLAVCVFFLYIHPDKRDLVSMPLDAHIVLGSALSFLIVMRTNSSMNCWWEARCSWDKIINCCHSIGAQTAPALRTPEACERVLMQLIAFVVALKADLRDETIQSEELGPRMDAAFVRRLNKSSNMPVQALKALSETVRTNLPPDAGNTKGLGSSLFDETSEQIRVMNHAAGACRKIKNTPMTYGYIATLRSFMVLWLVSLPMALVGQYGWMATPALSFISFLFLNIEQMAVEIEQPFGDDANDLPMELYILGLQETLLEMTPGYEPPPEEGGLEQRLAMLESMWSRSSNAQAQQIEQLKRALEGRTGRGRTGRS